jgi:retinol dehydrogenase-12
VYIAARSQPKAEEAIKDLKTQTGKEAFFLKLDLGDLKSVKRAAEDFLSKEKRLDVLFNNGRVWTCPCRLIRYKLDVFKGCHGSALGPSHYRWIRPSVWYQRPWYVHTILQLHSTNRRLTFHHIGHFYFTKLLLPTLISTAKSSQDGKARVVNTSSSAHMFSNLNFETFKDGPERRKKTTETFYAQSKFVNYPPFFWLVDEAIT